MESRVKRSTTRVVGFEDAEMDFQLIRQLGSCAYGGASVGECLSLARLIKNGSSSSWVSEFTDLAKGIKKDADIRLNKGHLVSGRDQYMRACNAYRAAEYYTEFRDSNHRELGMKSRECFHNAMETMDHGFESHNISFENIKLPLYFVTPRKDGKKRKTIMILSGFDGTLEEHYIVNAKAAMQRDYNVVLFSGPGQMDTLRFHPETTFLPDFEKPVTKVIDFVLNRTDVDENRLALLGVSFGGYFATRAAAYEPRIRALIANSPIVDLHAYMSGMVGFDPADMPDEENFGQRDLPNIPGNMMTEEQKSLAGNLMGRFGQPTFRDTFIYMKEFDVKDKLKNIVCPCLAMVGDGEGGEAKRQFRYFCENVSGPTTSHLFTEREGADSHCQVGNAAYSNAVLMDWLDEIFYR